MNDQQLATKVNHDANKVKNDINTLVEDGSARVTKFGDNISQTTGKAKEDLTKWVENNVSQLSEGFGKLTDDAKVTVVKAAESVKKDVGHGLSQYNAKAQEVAEKVPGGLGEKAAKYPWVTITIALAIGFLLGSLIKPVRLLLG